MVIDTTRYAFRNDGEAATLEEFYSIYTEIKQTDITKIKIERPKSDYDDAPPCIELMAINKIPEGWT